MRIRPLGSFTRTRLILRRDSTMCSARVTHIFVTENLSAKKAQHYLEARRKNGTKLVTPEWAIACAEKGKRVSEAKFAAPVFNEVGRTIQAIARHRLIRNGAL